MASSYALLLAVPLVWGLNFVFGRALAASLPPFTIAAGRFSIAALVFGAWLLLKKKSLPPPETRLPLLLVGLSGVFAFNSILYLGLRYTTAVNGTLINSFNPMVTVFLASQLLKEKTNWRQYGGAALSLLGVALIVTKGSLRGATHLSFNLGDVIIFFNTFTWAFFSTYGKKVMETLSPVDTIAYSTVAGFPFLLAASLLELWRYGLPAFSWGDILALVFLGLFASVLAFIWWYTGIQRLGAARAANFYNLIPVYSIVISAIFLGERIFIYHLAGGALILLGIALSSSGTRRLSPPQAPEKPGHGKKAAKAEDEVSEESDQRPGREESLPSKINNGQRGDTQESFGYLPAGRTPGFKVQVSFF